MELPCRSIAAQCLPRRFGIIAGGSGQGPGRGQLHQVIDNKDKDNEDNQTLSSIEHPIMHNYFPQH